MIHPLLKTGRFLFVVEGCSMCAIWKKCIDEINMNLTVDKQIEVIDCTDRYEQDGFNPDPRIDLFAKYINGNFPMLFIEGGQKYGASSMRDVTAWLRARLRVDAITRYSVPGVKRQECSIIETGKLKGKVICN